jgi:glutaredoxin
VEFVEKDVRKDYQALYELIDDLGSRQTPTLLVDKKVILGFDPREYAAALELGTE